VKSHFVTPSIGPGPTCSKPSPRQPASPIPTLLEKKNSPTPSALLNPIPTRAEFEFEFASALYTSSRPRHRRVLHPRLKVPSHGHSKSTGSSELAIARFPISRPVFFYRWSKTPAITVNRIGYIGYRQIPNEFKNQI